MIKIFLEVVNSALIFAVTDQDDSLRGSFEYKKLFTATNGVRIVSIDYVDISDHDVMIRNHDRDCDGDVVHVYFDNRENALKMKEKILEAFQEFKENGYFDGKKEAHKNPLNQSYYEF